MRQSSTPIRNVEPGDLQELAAAQRARRERAAGRYITDGIRVIGDRLLLIFWAVVFSCVGVLGMAVIEQMIVKFGAPAPETPAKVAVAPDAAVLQITTDADCELRIDEQSQGRLSVGEVRRLEVLPGQRRIECASVQNRAIKARAERSAVPGETRYVGLTMADRDAREKVVANPTRNQIARVSGIEMVDIPAGTFWTQEVSWDALTTEQPAGPVAMRAFQLGKYEVTRGQYRAFVEATGYRTEAERDVPVGGRPSEGCVTFLGETEPGATFGARAGGNWRDPGFEQTDAHPVVCVSWNDARAYVKWLSRETGQRYRLPSLNELRYAYRAGTTDFRPWGRPHEPGCRYANYSDASLKARIPWWTTDSCSDGAVFTAAVGSYAANAWGLHDTAGNVSEWAQDCLSGTGAAAMRVQSWDDANCERRPEIGGSWGTGFRWLGRLESFRPASRDGGRGFRLAKTL